MLQPFSYHMSAFNWSNLHRSSDRTNLIWKSLLLLTSIELKEISGVKWCSFKTKTQLNASFLFRRSPHKNSANEMPEQSRPQWTAWMGWNELAEQRRGWISTDRKTRWISGQWRWGMILNLNENSQANQSQSNQTLNLCWQMTSNIEAPLLLVLIIMT